MAHKKWNIHAESWFQKRLASIIAWLH